MRQLVHDRAFGTRRCAIPNFFSSCIQVVNVPVMQKVGSAADHVAQYEAEQSPLLNWVMRILLVTLTAEPFLVTLTAEAFPFLQEWALLR